MAHFVSIQKFFWMSNIFTSVIHFWYTEWALLLNKFTSSTLEYEYYKISVLMGVEYINLNTCFTFFEILPKKS